MLCPRNRDVLLKSRMRENLKSGSVRDVNVFAMAEYCDTFHTERGKKRGIQSMPKGNI